MRIYFFLKQMVETKELIIYLNENDIQESVMGLSQNVELQIDGFINENINYKILNNSCVIKEAVKKSIYVNRENIECTVHLRIENDLLLQLTLKK